MSLQARLNAYFSRHNRHRCDPVARSAISGSRERAFNTYLNPSHGPDPEPMKYGAPRMYRFAKNVAQEGIWREFREGDPIQRLAELEGDKTAAAIYELHVIKYKVYGRPDSLEHWAFVIWRKGAQPVKEEKFARAEMLELKPNSGLTYPLKFEDRTEVVVSEHFREYTITKAIFAFDGTKLVNVRQILFNLERGNRRNLENCHDWINKGLKLLENKTWMTVYQDGVHEMKKLQEEEVERQKRYPDGWHYDVFTRHDQKGGDLAGGRIFIDEEQGRYRDTQKDWNNPEIKAQREAVWVKTSAGLPANVAYQRELMAWQKRQLEAKE